MQTLKEQIEPLILEIIYDTTEFTCKGNQSKAARLLGISRGTLRKYLKMFSETVIWDKDTHFTGV